MYDVFGQVLRLHLWLTHSQLEGLKVHPGQPGLLGALAHSDGLSQRELAQHMNLSAPTVTVMLRRIEKVGLVERRPDPGDQRVTRVYLTEEGRRMTQEVAKVLSAMHASCFKGFTPDEEATMEALLTKVRDNLLQERAARGAPCLDLAMNGEDNEC